MATRRNRPTTVLGLPQAVIDYWTRGVMPPSRNAAAEVFFCAMEHRVRLEAALGEQFFAADEDEDTIENTSNSDERVKT